MPAGMPQADDSAGSYPGGRLGGALSDGARSGVKAPAGAAEVPAGAAGVPAGAAEVPAGAAEVPAGAAEVPAAAKATSGPRAFNPLRVGRLEAAVWVAYYRRKWARFLVLSILVVRSAFGMDWIRTVHGAWLVLRANQLWAPPELGSDVAGARRCMRRFYALLRLTHGVPANPARAAELEVEWWGVHRRHQRGENGDATPLVDALARLYAFSFGIDEAALRPAAEQRARAMDMVDEWVTEGRRMDSPLLPSMRAALVRSYAALLAAVHH